MLMRKIGRNLKNNEPQLKNLEFFIHVYTLAFPILAYMSVSFRNVFLMLLSLPQTVLNSENLEMTNWGILSSEGVFY